MEKNIENTKKRKDEEEEEVEEEKLIVFEKALATGRNRKVVLTKMNFSFAKKTLCYKIFIYFVNSTFLRRNEFTWWLSWMRG